MKATIYCKYQSEKREQNCKYLLTNYEGYLKDSTTIENWHMVPPYPKISEKFKRNIIESESLPHTYKFKYFPAKEKLDVTKAWISKYRKS